MNQTPLKKPITIRSGVSSLIEQHLIEYFAAHNELLPAPGFYKRFLQEVERPLLRVALQAVSGSQVKAAQILGISRNTLRKKMRDLNISPDNL